MFLEANRTKISHKSMAVPDRRENFLEFCEAKLNLTLTLDFLPSKNGLSSFDGCKMSAVRFRIPISGYPMDALMLKIASSQ